MSSNKITKNNPYMRDALIAKKMRIRSIASSTAIETGESIKKIESKILNQKPSGYSVKLA